MSDGAQKNGAKTPFSEWIFGSIGLVLVALTLGFMGYKALSGDGSPPDVHVRSDSIVPLDQGYLVIITAENGGDEAAAAVKVEGEIKSGSASVEKSETTFQYIPAQSERKGGLYFTHDPSRLELVLSARGYQKP